MNLPGIFPPSSPPSGTARWTTRRDEQRGRWMATGLRGRLALGTNGEAAYVDDEEADRIVSVVREEVPRDRVLIAGTGRSPRGPRLPRRSAPRSAGADAVLVRAPSYFKSQMTRRRSCATTGPSRTRARSVLLYNFPNGSAWTFRAARSRSSRRTRISSGSSNRGANREDCRRRGMRSRWRPSRAGGSAPILHAAIVVGAAGGILAVAYVVPDVCVEAVRPGPRRAARRGARSPAAVDAARQGGDVRLRRRRSQGRAGSRRLRGRRRCGARSARRRRRSSRRAAAVASQELPQDAHS